jgi:hypothetical protein
LWIVPSIVAGDWRMDFAAAGGNPQPIILSFNQQYQMLNAANKGGSLKIDNPILKGDEIDFFIAFGTANYRFTGKVQGDRMEGAAVSSLSSKPAAWRATRLPPDKK